jgi:urease accessory protein
MASSSTPISVRAIHPHTEMPPGLQVVELPMSATDRRRVRRLVEAADGVVFALELPTGTILQPGQLLHHDAQTAYVVSAADEDVLVVAPRDLAEAARVGHLIGNMHRDIYASGNEIIALGDEVLAERLSRAGLRVDRARRPFLGRAPGEHSH